ncbi:glycosyltransferase [Flavobacterium frigidarium]|uniref:glycosyltransferase n=1 Tax=Flavobacterium frigidarium TaxID=99286 RepID=UPI0004161E28|nr:glycosyltransferase [Flavobacterium frigidarium]
MINNVRLKHNDAFVVVNEPLINSIATTKQIVKTNSRSEVLFITSYPPRECGIATYSQDLIFALNNKFENTFDIKIAALETKKNKYSYGKKVVAVLETDNENSYRELAAQINNNTSLELVLIQHEFGLFRTNEADFIDFLKSINKSIIIVFHTVLPNPDAALRENVAQINASVDSFIVMTKNSAKLLHQDYGISMDKITVIPHGIHLVKYIDKEILKEKYNLLGRKVISTFGLLSSGKSIETTLDAMPAIIAKSPNVLFLIIGKTHPSVVLEEGEKYREGLEHKIETLGLQQHVKFINSFLPLDELLDYLQLTDIYLFTSNDPNQAVSGTFSYAISCGCPVISTPIPHANELIKNKGGLTINFGDSNQLVKKVTLLLDNPKLRKEISSNGIHKMAPTAWENSAIAHATLFKKFIDKKIRLQYITPKINLNHLKELTTSFAMIQFSVINKPDFKSGYTLDDNARALVAMCQHFELTNDLEDLTYINRYYEFIHFCQQKDGTFLNYVATDKKFTEQNSENLEDSNGRAIWALGFLLSMHEILPKSLIINAKHTMQAALIGAVSMHSTRAMAFTIKGIYYSNKKVMSFEYKALIKLLANRLMQMYKHELKPNWHWFESYMTYGNSILPEAMLCAYLATGEIVYKEIAKTSFDFLLTKIMSDDSITVISNKGWLHHNAPVKEKILGGEQPIDVAYTILALAKFYETFRCDRYQQAMEMAFSWFLGNNHLHKIIYNPCTGGCYDGLEDSYVNLNQGAESTVSYLMARLTMEKLKREMHDKSMTIKNRSVMLTN